MDHRSHSGSKQDENTVKDFQMDKMKSDAENISFSDIMYQVTEQLTKSETEQLKFLYTDFIPIGNLESMEATDLLQTLCERRIVTNENLNLLIEGLILIGRLDITDLLGAEPDVIDGIRDKLQKYSSISGLSGFKILIFDFADNITKKEVKMAVFHLHEKVNFSKEKQVNCITGFDLITHLMKAHFIHPQKLNNLAELALRLGRKDLIEKIGLYSDSSEESYASVSKQNSSEESYPSVSKQSIQLETNRKVNPREKEPANWSELVLCIPTEKHYSFCEDLGISGKKYKLYREDLGTLLDNSFGNNVFKISDLEEAIMKLNLNDQLCLEKLQPKPPAIPVKNSDQGSNLLKYKMTTKPRGICLIINNEKFDTHTSREGSTIDREAFRRVFKSFHFEIIVAENLTSQSMMYKFKEVASLDHSEYSCFVCCILSHGKEGEVFGTDGKSLPYKMLTVPFKPDNCQSLTGKPKLFFIQACQGTEKQRGSEYSEINDWETDSGPLIPNEADFLMAYSTVQGYASFRSKSKGSWFIQNLCRVFSENAERYDLSDMLLIVNNSVSQYSGKIHPREPFAKQIPAPLSTLRKKVFFLEE